MMMTTMMMRRMMMMVRIGDCDKESLLFLIIGIDLLPDSAGTHRLPLSNQRSKTVVVEE